MSTAIATPFSHFLFYYSILCCCCCGFLFLLCTTAAKGGASRPACAACKHQRRKCTADCPLALYFPADQPRQFQNAHRLFGVSNILRILKDLDPAQKAEAMKSILYEANVWDYNRADGCVGLIFNLQIRIHQLQIELEKINTQIAMYQSDQHRYYHSSTHLQLGPSSSSTSQSPLPPATLRVAYLAAPCAREKAWVGHKGASPNSLWKPCLCMHACIFSNIDSFDFHRCQIHRTHMHAGESI